MEFISRLLSGLFVLSALLLTLTSLSVDWVLELYAPMDQYGNRVSLLDLQRKTEQLSNEMAIAMDRIIRKEAVVHACMDGDMTLCEAAARFRTLHEDPRSWHHPSRPRPEFDDGESWCREVLKWAEIRVHFQRSDSQAHAVLERLETELEAQMECEGEVFLPD